MTETETAGEPGSPGGASLAAEYALGLLEGSEARVFAARLANDPDLRAEVARWQEQFAAMGMEVDDVAPPASVLALLKRELWGENKLPWRRRIRIWEFALGGIAAALVAWAVVNFGGYSEHVAPQYQARIESEIRTFEVVVALDSQSGLLRIERSGDDPAIGRDYELWAIVGDATPVSLGVLPPAPVTALRLSAEQLALIDAGTVLALSDEPKGGSPTGAPTGAVLGAGAISLITNL